MNKRHYIYTIALLLALHTAPAAAMLTLARNTATQAQGATRALVTRGLSQAAQPSRLRRNVRYVGHLVGCAVGVYTMLQGRNMYDRDGAKDTAFYKLYHLYYYHISKLAITAGCALGGVAGWYSIPAAFALHFGYQEYRTMREEYLRKREEDTKRAVAREEAYQEWKKQRDAFDKAGLELTPCLEIKCENRGKNAEEAQAMIDSCVGLGPVDTLFAILTSPPDLPPLG